MRGLALAGVVVLLGIVSFFIPMPHTEHHGVNLGDAHIAVTTQHDEKVPPALSIMLVVAGAGLVMAGRKAQLLHFVVARANACSRFVSSGDSPFCKPPRPIMRHRY